MIPYQVPRDELLVLADRERHLARRVDRHVDHAALKQKEDELKTDCMKRSQVH